MSSKSEPMYIHLILYVVMAVLVFILIKVAYIDPNKVVEQEKYYKQESRLRMSNLRVAERLWDAKNKQFTDNLDSLIMFLKNDPSVQKAMTGTDTITGKPTNHTPYIIQVDTSETADTVIDRRGRIIKIDTIRTIGQRYFIKGPDGYGTIGDVSNEALKNTASWE